MKPAELLARATESLEARTVYADAFEKDGVTVIPSARITGGGGGGSGQDDRGQQGEGSGFGLIARPAGAFVIKNGEVRWEPAVDVNRTVATVGAVAVTALLVVGRIVRTRAKAAARAAK
jgi:uncharacterized spore protein YtfJ